MRSHDVTLGSIYTMKVGGKLTPIKIVQDYGDAWRAVRVDNGRLLPTIRDASRLAPLALPKAHLTTGGALMTVYILTSRYFGDTTVHGVFDSLANARKAQACLLRYWRSNDERNRDCVVSQFTMNDVRVYQD